MTESAPPVYNPVSTTEENEDKPPSYFNIISQLKTAKTDSKSPVELGQKTISILCGSFLATIFLAISSILPVAMLIIGILSQEKCFIQPKIPLWLIVMGACGIASAVLKFLANIITTIRMKKTGERKEPTLINCFTSLISLFLFVWFIIGNFWVYSIYKNVRYDQTLYPEQYCDKLCYLFAFWSITVSWILLALTCFCICGVFICICGFAGCLMASKS